MAISVRLPESIERQLLAYCQSHRISKSQAVKEALDLFLADKAHSPTPYELGESGFGADKAHTGSIARQSKTLLRNKFRGKTDC